MKKIKKERKNPPCDYGGECKNKAYAEVYPSVMRGKHTGRGWSYLCRKHYVREEKKYKWKLPAYIIKNKSKLPHKCINVGVASLVEKTLKNAGELMTVAELKRRLPKKVLHQTLVQILDYLQESGKILAGRKGILWIYYPSKKLAKAIKKGTELI